MIRSFGVEKRLYRMQLHPVILKHYEGKYQSLAELIFPVVDKIKDDLPLLLRPRVQQYVERVTDLFPLFDRISSFRYLATMLPTDILEDILDGENNTVEAVFPNSPMYALYSYTIPPYVLKKKTGKEIKFVTTYQTKRMLGIDIANKKGYTGSGIKVLVADTGASHTHEQLRGLSLTYTSEMAQKVDKNGHGTWCVSCILGRKARVERLERQVGKEVIVEGMAPEASGISDKVLGYVIGTGATSNIAKALERAMKMGVDVVSMSLGGEVEASKPEEDALHEPIKQLTENGTIVVVAAGNSGPGEGTINSPGALPDALTVGAWDEINGELARFSSRGPTPWGDVKPDVIAPGVNIVSATTGILDSAGDRERERYSPLSGTSMATPHVAGLLVVAKQAYRDKVGKELTTEEVKAMMVSYGGEKNNEIGWGMIDWRMIEEWVATEHGVNL